MVSVARGGRGKDVAGLHDCLRFLVHFVNQAHQQALVPGDVIEHRSKEAGRGGCPPDRLWAEARQGQETGQALGIGGQEAQRLYGNLLGLRPVDCLRSPMADPVCLSSIRL